MNVDQSLAAAAKFDFKVASHSNSNSNNSNININSNSSNMATAPAAGLQENPRLQGVSKQAMISLQGMAEF